MVMSDYSDKAKSLNGVYTGGYARFYIQVISTESMKGGMLMKSKHCTYGKKADIIGFSDYHGYDNFCCKSTITASAQAVIAK